MLLLIVLLLVGLVLFGGAFIWFSLKVALLVAIVLLLVGAIGGVHLNGRSRQ